MTHRLHKPNSASLALRFFLVVVDYETKRYSVDGPIVDIEPWDEEIVRIRNAGRDVWSFPAQAIAVNETAQMFRKLGFDEWPAGSIVDVPRVFTADEAAAPTAAPQCRRVAKTGDVMPATPNDAAELLPTAPTRTSAVRRRSKLHVRPRTKTGE